MENKAPFSRDNFEELLRKQFLEIDPDNLKNKKIMETLSQHVAGSDVFVASSTGAGNFFSLLKKLGILSFVSVAILGGIYMISSKKEAQFSHYPNEQRQNSPILIEVENVQENTDPEVNPEPKRILLPVVENPQEKRIGQDYLVEQALQEIPSGVKESTIDINEKANKKNMQEDKPKILQDTESYPNLTPEEIKENHKQKRKIINRLLKEDKSTWVFIPSGKVMLRGEEVSVQAFTMRTTEVTNLEYRTFLFDLIIKGRKEDFLTARPTQSVWRRRFREGLHEAMAEQYFSHPAYNDYPVVNVTRIGAEMYCKWLSEECSGRMKELGKVWKHPAELRLPLEAEWIFAASGGSANAKNSTASDSLRNEKSCYLANYSCVDEEDAVYDSTLRYYIPKDKNGFRLMDDGGFYMVSGSSYHANEFGLFCMSGNVSEMIYRHTKKGERGKEGTIGGSWMSPSQFLRLDAPEEWPMELNGPSPMIGFRPVYTFLH